jgi:hypothetical protein
MHTSDVPTTAVFVLLIVGKSVVVCQRWGCSVLGHENPPVCFKIIRGIEIGVARVFSEGHPDNLLNKFTFKPFEIIFSDYLRVFRIKEYILIMLNLVLIFTIFPSLFN